MRKFMVGRKRRQNIKRQPDGRPVPDKGLDPKAIAQLMPHRRLVPAAVAHDPKAESVLGRLCLNGWLNETQYQAGVKYRSIVMAYRSVISAPRDAVSMSGVIVGPWGGGSTMTDERDRQIRDAYMRAHEALEEHPDQRCARDVTRCVVQDRTNFTLAVVRCGLNLMAEHLGLTNSRKSSSGINRR